MDLMQSDTWSAPFISLWQDLAPLLPRVSAALALLLLGWGLGLGLRAMARFLLRALGLDRHLGELWLFQVWSRGHGGQSPSQALGNMAFYGIIFVSAVLAIRALGAGMGVEAFAALMNVVPRVLSVVLILLLGGLLAAFVSAVLQLALAGSKLPHAVFWGKVAAWATFSASIMFALEPLGLAGQLVSEAMLIVLASLGLAAGLAFGLGCKDLAKEFLLEMLHSGKGA
jgi:hypothetical protein